MGEPVCLIRWLQGDESEVERVHVEWLEELDIRVVHASSKREVLAGIRDWATGNDAAQCLYIAAHGRQHPHDGSYVGIDRGDGADWIAWLELGTFLAENVPSPPVVWLGACGSAAAGQAWNECLRHGYQPAAWLVGFGGTIVPPILEAMLSRSLSNMRLENIVFVEQELPKLREAAGSAVQMFYPAFANDTKRMEYVSVDDEFAARVGMPFNEFARRRKS